MSKSVKKSGNKYSGQRCLPRAERPEGSEGREEAREQGSAE